MFASAKGTDGVLDVAEHILHLVQFLQTSKSRINYTRQTQLMYVYE